MKVFIEKLDDFGRGIAHVNKKVVFVKNALPKEVVEIKIIKDKKSFSEALIVKVLGVSNKRVFDVCPYFNICGGCHLLHLDYDDTLIFKQTKIKELLKKNKIDYEKEIDIVKSDIPLNYRNKISLKIENKEIGFYQENTHKLIPIKECVLAKSSINEVIKNSHLLNLENANLTIRSNYNDEILLIINTCEKPNIELDKLKEKIKLVGIVFNEKTIYGNNFFYERLNNRLFKVSFDSFFQINLNIASKLFDFILDNIRDGSKVLDLYSGVGTLGIVASSKALKVYSVEIIKNAVLNGIFNASLNKRNNIKYILGDVSNLVNKINEEFDTLIIDPPRRGLDKNTIDFILRKKPSKIIYVSCDANTLMRDLKKLEDSYEINDFKIMDMFSFTYHVECMCILNIKDR